MRNHAQHHEGCKYIGKDQQCSYHRHSVAKASTARSLVDPPRRLVVDRVQKAQVVCFGPKFGQSSAADLGAPDLAFTLLLPYYDQAGFGHLARSMPCVWHCHVSGTLSGVSRRASISSELGGQLRLCQGLRLPVHQLDQRLSLHVQARRHELPREAASPLRPSPDAAGDDVDCASSLRLILGCQHKQQHLRVGEVAFDVRLYDRAHHFGQNCCISCTCEKTKFVDVVSENHALRVITVI